VAVAFNRFFERFIIDEIIISTSLRRNSRLLFRSSERLQGDLTTSNNDNESGCERDSASQQQRRGEGPFEFHDRHRRRA
jgi:hypothetical protein